LFASKGKWGCIYVVEKKRERNWDDFRSSSQSTAMGKKKLKVGAFWDSGNEKGWGVTQIIS
jgi:hypothetical protein